MSIYYLILSFTFSFKFELILAIDDYINYYNYDRIKEKLKGLSPVNYRLQSSN